MTQRRTKPAPTPTRRRWATWVVAGLGVAVIGLLVWYISTDLSGPSQDDATPPDGVETFTVASADHTTETVQYAQDPPVGGPHDSTPLACGAYQEAVRNENAVHSLEHGAVWITYRPDLDEGDAADLDGFARQSEVIVSPYPGLDVAVVVSSWGTQLRLDQVDDDAISQFIRAFKNRTAPESAATC